MAALLVAERRRSRLGRWIFKPLAASCFVWAALDSGALSSDYGRRILVGLSFSWLGDLLLLPEGLSRWFRAGLLAFLFAHLAYTAAFLTFPVRGAVVAMAAVLVGLGVAAVLRWLGPDPAPGFRWPVRAYLTVIAFMVTVSFAAVEAGGPPALLLGALGFAASDLSVAQRRFLDGGFGHLAWGLPLYFAAQLLLASSTGAAG